MVHITLVCELKNVEAIVNILCYTSYRRETNPKAKAAVLSSNRRMLQCFINQEILSSSATGKYRCSYYRSQSNSKTPSLPACNSIIRIQRRRAEFWGRVKQKEHGPVVLLSVSNYYYEFFYTNPFLTSFNYCQPESYPTAPRVFQQYPA